MSPSEDELRAALHAGEGDTFDVNRAVIAGSRARARRRSVLTQVAAAVVFVGAAGGLVGVINSGGSNSTSADSQADSRADSGGGRALASGEPVPGGAKAPNPASTSAASSASSGAGLGCPPALPARLQPGAKNSNQLFERPAVTILVCSYGSRRNSASGAAPAVIALTGRDAEVLQRSLENASSKPTGASCEAVGADDVRRLLFVAADAEGELMRSVTTTLTVPVCDSVTSNGAVTRYAWVPPSDLAQQIYALSPKTPGKIIGSPVR